MPIIMPMPIYHHTYSSSGPTKFIQSTDNTFININSATECDVYHGFDGKWWVRFKISGNIRYYFIPFETEQEAKKVLIEFIEEKKS